MRIFPRYQRDAAKLLDATEHDEMERQVADDPERHQLIRARAECGRRGGRADRSFRVERDTAGAPNGEAQKGAGKHMATKEDSSKGSRAIARYQ
jgi:hypothetical protein